MITPRDWEQVRDLFHQAMQRPADDRAGFVRDHAGNAQILREVESLLAAQPEAEGFLSTPPYALEPPRAAPRLSAHSRLGSFEILGLLGAGGMGEVYRARDTRLDRTVAVKVLSRDQATHPRGRERFEREARVISKLTHPHVCTLHDVGVATVAGVETQFLVMELVDGETLAARLQRGPLPVDQAIKTGIEILDALSAAHAAGIIHRDLKPGNIMLTKSGVKLLDFGLARLRVPATTDGAPETEAGDPLTKEGSIVGTLPYMSPEQLRSKEADAQTDLFAFGAVLYEMLTGTRAFQGDSQADLIAAILERDPPALETRAPQLPPALGRIVAACLEKDPDDRWPRARDVLRELTWVRDDPGPYRTPAAPVLRTAPRRWMWGVALAAVTLAALGTAVWRRDVPSPPRVSFQIEPPKGTTLPRSTAHLAISPDGTRLVFVALSVDGLRRLWVRRFDGVESRAIAGTEDAHHPFWSPDGRSIGFFARDKLVRIDETGGARQVLCDAPNPRGGAWSRQGAILFSSNLVLHRVAAAGGRAAAVTSLDGSRKERAHVWPAFLPDERRFLYVSLSHDAAQSGVYRATLDAPLTERVLSGTISFSLAADRLLSLNNRSLMVHRFDADRGQVTGGPVEVAKGVGLDVRIGHGAFTAVPDTALAYRIVGDQSRLTWYDWTGRPLGSFRESGDYQHPWLSPDEKQIVVEKTDATTSRHTIWTLDLAREVTTRLLDDGTGAHQPILSPDGRHLVFNSNRLGGVDLYSMRADGTGDQTLLLSSPERVMFIPSDWSLDHRLLLYFARGDLWVLPLAPPGPPQPFLRTNANEIQGRFSPDLRWIAYTSDESGVPEIYVRRYPGGDGMWRVSTNGGAQPQWRRDGKELFYLAADGKLMAADVRVSASGFATDPARPLFDTGIKGLFVDRRNHYVVTRDGQRFLLNVTAEDDNLAPITVVMNWTAGIER